MRSRGISRREPAAQRRGRVLATSVAEFARQTDEVTRWLARDAQEGGATAEKAIRGVARLRDAMKQSATAMRDMGKRAGEMLSNRVANVPDTDIITVCVAASRTSTLLGAQDSLTRALIASHRRDGPISAIPRADGVAPL